MEILAAGDVVNITMDGLTSYQPAATVSLFILKTFRANVWSVYVGFQNGVTTSGTYSSAAPTEANRASDWSRFAITNSEYYFVSAATNDSGFSAIQIK